MYTRTTDIIAEKSLGKATFLVNRPLNLEKNVGLPVIELGNLIKFDHSSRENLLIASLNGLNQNIDEFGLPSRRKPRILRAVLLHIPFSRYSVLNWIQ